MIRTALALALLFTPAAHAATVLSVGDGDTLRVDDGGQRLTVRLACIDAPEKRQAPYGLAARQQLLTLAPIGSQVTLRTQGTDRYGRTIAELFTADGGNVNLAMVASGHAFAYKAFLRRCDRIGYLKAERSAEAASRGVWAAPGGITRPWTFRKQR